MPLGKVKIERAGTDLTIVAFSKMVGNALQAAETLARGSAEVVNLRSIRPLDREGGTASVDKTSCIVTVEEGWPQSGVVSHGSSPCSLTRALERLDAVPERLIEADVPMHYTHSSRSPPCHSQTPAARRSCYGAA